MSLCIRPFERFLWTRAVAIQSKVYVAAPSAPLWQLSSGRHSLASSDRHPSPEGRPPPAASASNRSLRFGDVVTAAARQQALRARSTSGDGSALADGQPPARRSPEELKELFKSAAWHLGSGVGLLRRETIDNDEPAPGLISPKSDATAIFHLFTTSYMNILLLCVPLGIAAHFFNWGAYATFILNFCALIPLALVLGEVTEDLALRFGETIGGLLNATFGNVVEMILSIAALTKGLYTVVAASLLGSILSNLLLVLGFCFLCGGTKYKQQSFNIQINKACCSLLFMACIALVIPTAAKSLFTDEQLTEKSIIEVSRGTAIILALMYMCYLFFTLKTHASGPDEETASDKPSLSLVAALGTLGGITVVVAAASEFLTGALEEVSKQSGLSEAFLGLIVLPIAGNACEHITAVFVAIKNKMDLAIGVALGSSIQIGVFVIPVVVVVGWGIGRPFALDFDPFIVLVLTLSVIHAYFVSSDGNSNWLLGVELIGVYVLISLLYFFVV
ncbi:hypothetical protein WJX72_000497 [[Myrmecia] bisecta]|uniref:Vacuolar cation/proton exchanger n=1 Tax=[Myrmecia] bisecta TaxID=41462 RepID=A0AAW1PF87_9CHLO